jgi:hypothetical protein
MARARGLRPIPIWLRSTLHWALGRPHQAYQAGGYPRPGTQASPGQAFCTACGEHCYQVFPGPPVLLFSVTELLNAGKSPTRESERYDGSYAR